MSPEKDDVLSDLRLGRRGRGILSGPGSSRCGQSCLVHQRASQTCHRYSQLKTVGNSGHSPFDSLVHMVPGPGAWRVFAVVSLRPSTQPE